MKSTNRVRRFRVRQRLEYQISQTLEARMTGTCLRERNRLLRKAIFLFNRLHPGSATVPSWSELRVTERTGHESSRHDVKLSNRDSTLRSSSYRTGTRGKHYYLLLFWPEQDTNAGDANVSISVGRLTEDIRDYWCGRPRANCPDWINRDDLFKRFYAFLEAERPRSARNDALLLLGYYRLRNDEEEMWSGGIGYPGRVWNPKAAAKYRERLVAWGNKRFQSRPETPNAGASAEVSTNCEQMSQTQA